MNFDDLKSEGNKAYKSTNYEKALEYYTKCLELQPNDHIIHSNRCLCYINLKNYDKALEEVETALKISPNHAKSYYNYGLILFNQNKPQESLEMFKKSYNLDQNESTKNRIEECELYLSENSLNIFKNSLEEKYCASMVLAGVGDAIGFNNGQWEFCFSGSKIHKELESMGGLENLKITPDWIVSDDTVMLLATGETLMKNELKEINEIMKDMAKEYIECFNDMMGRSPGPTTGSSIYQLKRCNWNEIQYNKSGGGCGGSMRAMNIGLKYPGKENRDMLIAVSIESGRLTHNHPTGFLGAMVSASFTALAIEGIPPKKWGYILLNELIPKSLEYCKQAKRDWEKIQNDSKRFIDQFTNYCKERGILDGESEPIFPKDYGVKERDEFYKKWSWAGWGGASGDDSCIIAYDAILGCNQDWKEFVLRGVLHGGDNDSTGVIGGAWYGALYGFKGVIENNYKRLEKRKRITEMGKKLYEIVYEK